MKARRLWILPLCLLGLMAGRDLGQSAPPTSAPASRPATQSASGSDVHSITLPFIQPPDMPENGLYLASCITCHSQRYVVMQPNFSRKTWTAEVEKMKKTYGAPIDDSVMPGIVDYLMSIRGTPEPKKALGQ